MVGAENVFNPAACEPEASAEVRLIGHESVTPSSYKSDRAKRRRKHHADFFFDPTLGFARIGAFTEG